MNVGPNDIMDIVSPNIAGGPDSKIRILLIEGGLIELSLSHGERSIFMTTMRSDAAKGMGEFLVELSKLAREK